MLTLPSNLVCTVGTSLFSPSLKNLKPEAQYQFPPKDHDTQAKADWNALNRIGLANQPPRLTAVFADIKKAFDGEDYERVGALFTALPPDLRLMGAEINSIEAMIRKGFLPEDRARLILLISDTKDGESIGRILYRYFVDTACPIRFDKCIVETVKGLQDEKPLIFQKDGLTNLIRLLGEHYRKWGGFIAINATGGYKAQIALAVAFGQATGSTVYYKHERFDQIIRFPQIPFTLDLSLVQRHLKSWADMAEPGKSFDSDEMEKFLGGDEDFSEIMYPLMERIEENGLCLLSLSALGMVYWEAYRSLNPDLTLEPGAVAKRNGCHFRDDHYPVGFKEYVKRFYDAFPKFVAACHSIPYDRQPSIRKRFHARNGKIIGEYQDRNGFGARFGVMTSADNELERAWLLNLFETWKGLS